jgi:dTDP-4-dehydrorhamnose 3,5-epimerase
MTITETALPGVLLITPKIYKDNRGSFWETFHIGRMAVAGLPTHWVQDNFSISKKNVVRGLHYQMIQPQGKLVRAASGAVLDVVVDLRRNSPTFGRHIAEELTDENGCMLWIPVGFAHGFQALTESVSLAYKVTDEYCPAGERTLLWNDPELAIAWRVTSEEAIVSEKDLKGALLRDVEVFA